MAKVVKGTKAPNRIDGTSGNDLVQGRDGDDVLNGFQGNDKLYAGKGNDYLIDEEGSDTYRPGQGDDVIMDTGPFDSGEADTFIFEKPTKGNFGYDTIDTFDYGADRILFEGYTAQDIAGMDASEGFTTVYFKDGGILDVYTEYNGQEGLVAGVDYFFV